LQAEIYDVDYTELIHLLGTTHFTRRSLRDAHRWVDRLKPTDLAVELDMKRYQILNDQCSDCSRSKGCTRKCEFIGAVDALENRDTNIWLIDMSKREFWERIQKTGTTYPHWRVLLKERDTLMAARLAWIATESLDKEVPPRVLAVVGAAHVKGIRSLLSNPTAIKKNLGSLRLSFTPPKLIRRIEIDGD
jgi:pheromone shutdown protein TraB